jgi:hypothetical protein
MTNPTSNFGWQMPTSSDLVTDLPADFEVFGQAVDTSLADLKGGTTGQVLKKNTNTDMDFVWSSDTGFANPMTTTGDMIYSSSGSTAARLGIGSSGQVLTVSGGVPTWASAGAGFVGCKATGSTSTFPHDTLTTMNYSSEDFDTDSFHSTSTNTNRFTVPSGKAGKYLCINNGLRFSNINMADAYMTVRVNGTEQFRQYPTGLNPYGRGTINNINIFNLAVGDYVDYAFYQASGSSVDLIAGSFVLFTYLGA